MGTQFLIKHRSGGKYLRPKDQGKDIKDETPLVLHKDVDNNMYWTFEKVRDQWGYIKHVRSEKIIHPQGGELYSGDKTPLVLHKDRHDGALFSIDVYNHRIVHLNGCFAQPENLKPNPINGTKVFLNSKVSNASNFIFVASEEENAKEVEVYGKPKVKGEWEILSMVLNPVAKHIEKIEIKIGKSRSEGGNTETLGKETSEISGELQIKFVKLSFKKSTTIEKMFNKASSDTWSKATTRTREIHVEPGKPVVTWQYVFTVEDSGITGIFKSDIIADTGSESQTPEELDDEIKNKESKKTTNKQQTTEEK